MNKNDFIKAVRSQGIEPEERDNALFIHGLHIADITGDDEVTVVPPKALMKSNQPMLAAIAIMAQTMCRQ